VQGVFNKVEAVKELIDANNYNLKNILYVGNDLNDFRVMQFCGISVCPIDSHRKIKEISNVVLDTRGGNGVVRELLEDVFKIDFIEVLYNN
jgi:3-deoxy-D-manno-octulosonate 8-phosphate phosphatase KdsC-like HAD superfamily phosphatase